LLRLFWRLFFRIQGWKVIHPYPYHLKKAVVVVGPHTSSMDFIVGLAIRSTQRLQRVHFLGKAELFKPPFGFLFRWLGGYPVDRSGKNNLVDQVVALFNQHETFTIALSPEGTRKKVDKLKTGFYHIALQAKVPIIIATMDFAKKEVFFSEPYHPTGNQQTDFNYILQYLGSATGYHPELGLQHLLKTNQA